MRRERGIALIQVLLVAGIIGLLMLQIGLTAREQVAHAQALADRSELQLAAQSREAALTYTLLTEPLVRVPDSKNPYAAAWNFHGEPFTVDGVTFTIQDESGKMQVPWLDSRDFEALLLDLGVEAGPCEGPGHGADGPSGHDAAAANTWRRPKRRPSVRQGLRASSACRTSANSGCCPEWTKRFTSACARC